MFIEALPESRSRFFLLRLALTALFVLLLVGIARFAWYPGLMLQLSGTSKHLLVASAVALVIGTGLSTLLYRPGKRGLLFDLVVVLVIELAVIIAVAGDLYQRRPYFAVFAVDRFELVTAAEVDWANIRYDELRSKPVGAPRLVYAKLPEDSSALSALIFETVLEGRGDVDRRPEFWLPYPDGIEALRASLKSLDNESTAGAWLRGEGRSASDFGYLPLRGQARDAAIVIERSSGSPVTILDFDPW